MWRTWVPFQLPPTPNRPSSGLGSGLHLRGYGAKSNNSYLAHWQNLAAGVLFQILGFGRAKGLKIYSALEHPIRYHKMYLRRIEIHTDNLIHMQIMQQQVYCFCMLLPFYGLKAVGVWWCFLFECFGIHCSCTQGGCRRHRIHRIYIAI